MKKQEQIIINDYAVKAYYAAMEDYENATAKDRKRLRSCSATVITTDRYIYLQSYSTIVAFYNRATHEFFDVLRFVYGYTATSAQHISKFAHEIRAISNYSTYRGV